MRTYQDLRYLRTERLLTEALIQLIKAKPYESIHVRDIVHAAGVSRSTFYMHYNSKDQLLGSLIQYGWEIVRPSDERLDHFSYEELLDVLVRTAVKYSVRNSEVVVIALREIQYSPYMAGTYKAVVDSVVRLINYNTASADIIEDRERLLAEFIVNGVFGCFISFLKGKTSLSNDEFTEHIKEMVNTSIHTNQSNMTKKQ